MTNCWPILAVSSAGSWRPRRPPEAGSIITVSAAQNTNFTGAGGAGTYGTNLTGTGGSGTITFNVNVETKFYARSSGNAGELVKITNESQ